MTSMTERTGRKRTAYSLIIGVILLTVPCYLLGIGLLWIARPNVIGSIVPTEAPAIATLPPPISPTQALLATPTQFTPPTAPMTAPAATLKPGVTRTATQPATATPQPTLTFTPSPTAPPTDTATPIPFVTDTPPPPPPPTDTATATALPLPTDTLAPPTLLPLITDTPAP